MNGQMGEKQVLPLPNLTTFVTEGNAYGVTEGNAYGVTFPLNWVNAGGHKMGKSAKLQLQHLQHLQQLQHFRQFCRFAFDRRESYFRHLKNQLAAAAAAAKPYLCFYAELCTLHYLLSFTWHLEPSTWHLSPAANVEGKISDGSPFRRRRQSPGNAFCFDSER